MPPPPPPPPTLTAPPGYAAYTPSPIAQAPLKRVRGVGGAARVLVAVAEAAALATIAVQQTVTDEADDFLAGRIDTDEFLEAVAPYALMSLVQSVATIAAAVLVIIWMYRIAANLRTLGRDTTWGPGWAIAGWVLPPLLYVIPTLMFRELWRASDPDVPLGGEWKSRPTSPLIWVWFAVYSLAPIALLAAQSGTLASGLTAGERQLAEQITDSPALGVVSAVVAAAGALVFILFATRLGARHQRLTGETTA